MNTYQIILDSRVIKKKKKEERLAQKNKQTKKSSRITGNGLFFWKSGQTKIASSRTAFQDVHCVIQWRHEA